VTQPKGLKFKQVSDFGGSFFKATGGKFKRHERVFIPNNPNPPRLHVFLDSDNLPSFVQICDINGETHEAGVNATRRSRQQQTFLPPQTFSPHQSHKPLKPSPSQKTSLANECPFCLVSDSHPIGHDRFTVKIQRTAKDRFDEPL
jgi:hypothetical protein